MATLIHDTTVITPAGADVAVRRAQSLLLDGDRIAEIGPADSFQPRIDAGEIAEVVDGRRFLTIPGLVNTHHHLYQSLTRCARDVQDVDLFRWLLGLYERWRGLDRDALRLAAQISLCEMLHHGGTTTSDHHYMQPPGRDAGIAAVLDAAETVGTRIHVCRGSMTLGQSRGGLPPDDVVECDVDVLTDYTRVLDAYHDPHPYAMRRVDLAPCSPFNVTPELLRDTVSVARERGVLLHTHLAETIEEEQFCLDRYGCRPVQYMADLGWLGPDVYLAHCVQLNDDEIRLFAETDTAIAHCPTSNMRLASGIAPLQRFLAAGIRVGVGVDGSSSNDGGNILGEARQALLASRVRDGVLRDPADRTPPPAQLPAATAFRLATTGGAAVLRRPELGHISVGAAADIAMFPADDIAFAGAIAQDPLGALVLCSAPRATHVFVAGRQLIRDGQVTTLDEPRLIAEFNALVTARFAG